MNKFIDIITQIRPKNGSNFPVADVNDLKGAPLHFETVEQRDLFTSTYSSRLTEGLLCYVTERGYTYLRKGNRWVEFQTGGSGGGKEVWVQDGEPIDSENLPRLDALWVKEENTLNTNNLLRGLLTIINDLSAKVNRLQYLHQEITPGEFNNNLFNVYDSITGLEPDLTTPEEDTEEALINTDLLDALEPTYNTLPNTNHISVKWGTSANMYKYKDDFIPAELLWCYDTRSLWIKDPKTFQLIRIGAVSDGGNIDINDDIMDGIIQQNDKIAGIKFIDMVYPSKSYTFLVENGEMKLVDSNLDTNTLLPNLQGTAVSSDGVDYYTKVYTPVTSNAPDDKLNALVHINMVYCGGGANDANTMANPPVDYNFVELANLTNNDLNLNGMYLHYTEGGLIGTNRYWITLPLKGVIKSGSTFLIRGAKCGNEVYSQIKVQEPDIIWNKSLCYNSGVFTNESYDVWDSDGDLRFSFESSFFLSGTLQWDVTSLWSLANPWTKLTSNSNTVCLGYVDLVGFGSTPAESTALAKRNSGLLALRYYNLDPVYLAFVAPASRQNSKDWMNIDLINTDAKVDLSKYWPKGSKAGKTIFFNKSKLEDDKPTFCTVTFGYNPHTTRCFTWVSKGYRDEFIRWKKVGDSEWHILESFKAGDNRTSNKHWDSNIYNRIRSFATDGEYFTVHKLIIDFEEPTSELQYVYQVGWEDHWTKECYFTLRNRLKVIDEGFTFVLVTDQQGFNAEEYETWRLAAEYINKKETGILFVLNTGDATQNGNRLNEWIDYFKAGESLISHLEHPYTVGNNDLCPYPEYRPGDGGDTSKNNPINMQYFFTFEHPNEIPISKEGGTYIPSVYSFVYGNTYFLCTNSEFTDNKSGNEPTYTEQMYGVTAPELYQRMASWCEEDLAWTLENYNINWKIGYCHEAPFTLLTNDDIKTFINNNFAKTTERKGSKFNSLGNFWYSEFLENHLFNLNLCGHKHTYSLSRFIAENLENRMQPIVFDPQGENAEWYLALVSENLNLIKITNDLDNRHYVKYVMCLATGYKLVSNKELPRGTTTESLPWLQAYYPNQSATGKTPAPEQKYPNYIVWNIGVGNEVENPEGVYSQEDYPYFTGQDRILGRSRKIYVKPDESASSGWAYKYYNAQYTVDRLDDSGGNGIVAANKNDNIVVRHFNYGTN